MRLPWIIPPPSADKRALVLSCGGAYSEQCPARSAVGARSWNGPESVRRFGALIGQIKRRTGCSVVHPHVDRLEIAAERIEVEKGHQPLGYQQVMQRIWWNENAAGCAVGFVRGRRVVGNLHFFCKCHRQYGRGIAMRRQSERRSEVERARGPHPINLRVSSFD
jgi:hypothetical protein